MQKMKNNILKLHFSPLIETGLWTGARLSPGRTFRRFSSNSKTAESGSERLRFSTELPVASRLEMPLRFRQQNNSYILNPRQNRAIKLRCKNVLAPEVEVGAGQG